MSKSTANFVVDAVAFAAFVFLTATGVLLRYMLPAGSGHFSALWGMDRHAWGRVHFWIAVVLMGVLALHLVLHWRWVVCMVKARKREGSGARVALALVGLLVLAGLAIAPFFAQVERTGAAPHKMRGNGGATGAASRLDGSMTLLEVEQATGVSAETVLRELGLPPDAPADEQLGRLRKRYGFEMEAVREIVRKHAERQ